MGLLDEINKSEGYIKYDKGRTDELIIIFSHIGYPAGKFAMSRVMADQKASKLYVNCENNSWYQMGIPGYTENIQDTIQFLKKIIAEINPSKTIACGMSMGGYAALLYGISLELDYVLAFTAELNIGSAHQRSFYLNRIKKYDPFYKDLHNLIIQNKKTELYLFYGAYDLIDMHGLNTIRPALKNPKFHIYLVSGDHKAAIRFDIPFLVVETLKNGEPPKNELVLMKNIKEEDLEYYKKYQEMERENEVQYDAFQRKEPKYSQDFFFYGRTCMHLNRFDEALDAFKTVIDHDPNFPLGYHLAGLTLNQLKQYEEAVEMYKKALKIDPELSTSYYRISQTQLILKNYDESEKNLLKTIELNPKFADTYFLLGSLYEIKMIQNFEISTKLAPENERFKQKLESIRQVQNKKPTPKNEPKSNTKKL